MKASLVSDDLDRPLSQLTVVIHFQHLAERAFAKHAKNFIAVGKMVTNNGLVVTAFIIISPIVLSCMMRKTLRSQEIDEHNKLCCGLLTMKV
jgi:hypothetical protein